jgi:hypothetical protein
VAIGPWYDEALINQEVKNFGIHGTVVAFLDVEEKDKLKTSGKKAPPFPRSISALV